MQVGELKKLSVGSAAHHTSFSIEIMFNFSQDLQLHLDLLHQCYSLMVPQAMPLASPFEDHCLSD